MGQLQRSARRGSAEAFLEISRRGYIMERLCQQQAWINLVVLLDIAHLGDTKSFAMAQIAPEIIRPARGLRKPRFCHRSSGTSLM